MPGEPFHRMNLFGAFAELVDDICQEAGVRSEHAVYYVGSELPVRFGKLPGHPNSTTKSERIPYFSEIF